MNIYIYISAAQGPWVCQITWSHGNVFCLIPKTLFHLTFSETSWRLGCKDLVLIIRTWVNPLKVLQLQMYGTMATDMADCMVKWYIKKKSFRGQYTLLSHCIIWGNICLKCAEKDTHFSHHRRLKPWHSSLKRMKTSHLVGQNQCKAITLATLGVGSMCTCAACRQWRLQWWPSRASAEICNCRSLCRSLLAYKYTQMWNIKKNTP